jgi:hypothetical protein
MESEHQSVMNILSHLNRDEMIYTSQLTYDKEGAKVNPIQLTGLNSIDSEQIGKHIIHLHRNWKPADEHATDHKIGTLYGFDCFIRQQQESYEDKGMFAYRYHNAFYVQHKDGGIKYTYNQGQPSVDNPKLAARHFLSALDRVGRIKEQYEKELQDLDKNMPVLQKLVEKPFEKEEELKSLKQDLSRLEREISIKIQESKLRQQQTEKEEPELVEANAIEETPVININIRDEEKQQPVQRVRKSRGMRM